MHSTVFRQTFRVGIALVGAIILTGCGKKEAQTLGKVPAAPVAVEPVAVRDLAKAPNRKPVTLKGVMVEKCPVAGCWFILKDKTGTVRVDTKAAGFVVTDVPLNRAMTVNGKVVAGSPPTIAASGIQVQ